MKKLLSLVVVVVLCAFARLSWAADPTVAAGKLVSVEYVLTVDEKEVESSVGKEPLKFVAGDKTILPALEQQLLGMRIGEEKVITLESKDGYGEADPKAIKEFPKSSMPKEQEPKVGMVLQAQAPDGGSFPATIIEVGEDKVKLDFNHPLAGKQLKFKIKVLEIADAPAAAPAK